MSTSFIGGYVPEKPSGPLPVIVWVHGGGWKNGNKDWRRAVPLVPKGYAVANKEKADKASPLHYVTKDAATFLIMHGDEDDVVPLSQSVKLADALRRAGVEVRLQIYKGSGHGGRAFKNLETVKPVKMMSPQGFCRAALTRL